MNGHENAVKTLKFNFDMFTVMGANFKLKNQKLKIYIFLKWQ